MTLTTTLNRLKAERACKDRYEHLLRSLGGPSADHDAPISLLYILDTNGLDDALWALRATVEDSESFSRLLACEYAERVLPIWEKRFPEDLRPRQTIEVARRYARGEATSEELDAARSAAWDAAWDAARSGAWDAARSAAGSAARSAAGSAAWDAAGSAAWDAAWDAARSGAWITERAEQERILRERLNGKDVA